MELLLFGNALCFGLISYTTMMRFYLATSRVREQFPEWRTFDDRKYWNLVRQEENTMKTEWGWMWYAHYLLSIPIIVFSTMLYNEHNRSFSEVVVQTTIFGVCIALALLLASGVQIARKRRRRKCKR